MFTFLVWEAIVATGSDEDFELLQWESVRRSVISLLKTFVVLNEVMEREWAIQIFLPLATRSSCQLWEKLGR